MKEKLEKRVIPETAGRYTLDRQGFVYDNLRRNIFNEPKQQGLYDMGAGKYSVKLQMENGKRRTLSVQKLVRDIFRDDYQDIKPDVMVVIRARIAQNIREQEKVIQKAKLALEELKVLLNDILEE